MEQFEFCILGAGPSGLAFARELTLRGMHSFLLLEKENQAGGLCRSVTVDGHPLDIGGGHFLDVRNRQVLDFLFELLPAERWQRHRRVAKLRIRGQEVDHPLESNIWQLDPASREEFLNSIAQAGCVQNAPEPTVFDDWIRWKLGERIADEYLLPYNRKLWSLPLDQLGTYWLEKLPCVSYQDTLSSCRQRKPLGSLPAHGEFYYPRQAGYGEVWQRMAGSLGQRLCLNCPVTSLDLQRKVINGRIQAKTIVSTIPWTCWPGFAVLPEAVITAARRLRHVSIDVDFQPGNVDSSAHWIYEPDERVPHHRLLLRPNFLAGATGHWTESNSRCAGPLGAFRHHNEYAYPVSTVTKRESLALILSWARKQGILPLGRWGLWEHLNSDVAVQQAVEAANHALRTT